MTTQDSRIVELPGEDHLAKIEMEDFCFARCGIRKDDLEVVALSINGHGFRFELGEFINFVGVMAENAKTFVDITVAIRKHPGETEN